MSCPKCLLVCCLGIGLMLGSLGAMAGPARAADTTALRLQLRQPLADTARVRVLAELCFLLHDEQPTRALQHGEQAVALARRLPAAGRGPLLMNSLLHLASCYANLSNGLQALRLIGEAQTLARQLNDIDGQARAYSATGGIYHERSDSATAWRHYRRALLLAEQPEVRARTRMKLLGNAANLLFYRQQHARALHLDSLALALARREGDAVAESHYLTSLGSYQLRLNNLPAAERILKQALEISRREKALRIQASQLELLAMYYIATEQPRQTEAVTREALRIARQSGFLERVLDAYNILGSEAAEHKNYREAYDWNQRYIARGIL